MADVRGRDLRAQIRYSDGDEIGGRGWNWRVVRVNGEVVASGRASRREDAVASARRTVERLQAKDTWIDVT